MSPQLSSVSTPLDPSAPTLRAPWFREDVAHNGQNVSPVSSASLRTGVKGADENSTPRRGRHADRN
jgi:hypothetical protein